MSHELNLCTNCPIPHVDNCRTCFGFGLDCAGHPVRAERGCSEDSFSFVVCKECGGMPKWFFGRTVLLGIAPIEKLRRQLAGQIPGAGHD